MYLDKLDGRIETAFFDSKSAEWRAEQDRLLRDVQTHQGANQTYIEEGVQLLHLAQRAHELFERQVAGEKRRLLDFLLSNCVWKADVLTAEYRQPFDMLALAREAAGDDEGGSRAKNGKFENWLRPLDWNVTCGPAPQHARQITWLKTACPGRALQDKRGQPKFGKILAAISLCAARAAMQAHLEEKAQG